MQSGCARLAGSVDQTVVIFAVFVGVGLRNLKTLWMVLAADWACRSVSHWFQIRCLRESASLDAVSLFVSSSCLIGVYHVFQSFFGAVGCGGGGYGDIRWFVRCLCMSS